MTLNLNSKQNSYDLDAVVAEKLFLKDSNYINYARLTFTAFKPFFPSSKS